MLRCRDDVVQCGPWCIFDALDGTAPVPRRQVDAMRVLELPPDAPQVSRCCGRPVKAPGSSNGHPGGRAEGARGCDAAGGTRHRSSSDETVTSVPLADDDRLVWWVWVLGVLGVWSVVATALGLLIGRAIRLADRRSPGTGVALTTADLPASFVAVPSVRRRAIPLPPVGIALAATGVALETVGYVSRLDGDPSRLLSMDAPFSLPRMY